MYCGSSLVPRLSNAQKTPLKKRRQWPGNKANVAEPIIMCATSIDYCLLLCLCAFFVSVVHVIFFTAEYAQHST